MGATATQVYGPLCSSRPAGGDRIAMAWQHGCLEEGGEGSAGADFPVRFLGPLDLGGPYGVFERCRRAAGEPAWGIVHDDLNPEKIRRGCGTCVSILRGGPLPVGSRVEFPDQ